VDWNPYLTLTEPQSQAYNDAPYLTVQGVAIGKRSVIKLKILLKDAGKEADAIELRDSAVKKSEGDILVRKPLRTVICYFPPFPLFGAFPYLRYGA
jgi:hypothetical protein